MTRMIALLAALSVTAGLTACGTKAAAGGVDVAALTADGKPLARLGFGTEGGEKPALIKRRAGGWAVAYAGTRSGDRHLYVATSADGKTFGKAQVVAAGDYSDQAPALVEDAAGRLTLYFASNRSGEDFALYAAAETNGKFGAASEVPGFDGVQDLAAVTADGKTTLVAEVVGAGLVAAMGTGTAFEAPTTLAEAGAEPAACALPSGDTLVAFQREGAIWTVSGKPGAWSAETDVARAADGSRLRDPGLAFAGGEGRLVYAERANGAFGLRLVTFDEALAFGAAEAVSTPAGDARGAAIASDHNGSFSLAWGMKTPSGQQGILVSPR